MPKVLRAHTADQTSSMKMCRGELLLIIGVNTKEAEGTNRRRVARPPNSAKSNGNKGIKFVALKGGAEVKCAGCRHRNGRQGPQLTG